MNAAAIRGCGIAVAVGGITWGAAWWLSPSNPAHNSQVEIWASGIFQLGLLAVLAVMWATRATGASRLGRAVLAAEGVAVLLASAWTIPYLVEANRPTTGLLAVLDPFWPVSMAGLIVVGALVVGARRWPTPTRYLPLAASLLLPIDLAVSWAPDAIRDAVTALYLAVTYGLLGTAISRHANPLADLAITPTIAR
jgi:hypothetical protein